VTTPSATTVAGTSAFDMLVALVCLVSLGALCGGAPLAVFGPLLIIIGLLPLILLLALFNPQARQQAGLRGLRGAISRGFVMLVPFTVLAAASHFWLHWNAAQVFTSSGLMAAGASAGYEIVKIGGGRIAGTILPTLWFFLMSAGWMLLAGLLAELIR
jgi:hypothetical protein